MLIIFSIIFYISLGVLAYMFVSKDRAWLNHPAMEERIDDAVLYIKKVASYLNKRTMNLFFHYAIDTAESAFLRSTQKLKNAVPKHKKQALKQLPEIKARTIKKAQISGGNGAGRQLPKQ